MLNKNPYSQLITIDERWLGGTPVFRGTRVPVQMLTDNTDDLEWFLRNFPTILPETAEAVLELYKNGKLDEILTVEDETFV